MDAGAVSPQLSQPDADTTPGSGQTHTEGFQPKPEQQTQATPPQASQPQPSQPQSVPIQSSPRQSSAPAAAHQQSGAWAQQKGVGSTPSSTLRDQASAQGGPAGGKAVPGQAEGRAVPGQAVSSEELTSSERGMQSVEGIRDEEEGQSAAQASSSSVTGPVEEQGVLRGGASETGPNADEPEDTTTRMMENAGTDFLGLVSTSFTK